MTDEATHTRIWTQSGFKTDGWTRAESLDGVAGDAAVILSLEDFLALDAVAVEARAGRLGVELQPGDPVDAVADRLDGLAVVALAFPGFADGRSYSKAQLLRTRHGYKGIIRATGEVLIDQIAHMLRTGFDEFEICNPVALERLAAGRTGGLGLHYQPTATPANPGKGYSWRRVTGPRNEDSPHVHHY